MALGDTRAFPFGHDRTDLSPIPLVHESSLQHDTDTQAPRIDRSIVSPNTSTCWACRCCVDASSVIRTSRARPTSQSSIGPRLHRLAQPGPGWQTRPFAPESRQPRAIKHKSVWTTIVGVIADARTESLADRAPAHYRTVYQRPSKDLVIYLRGQLDPRAISAQVREQVQSIDPEIPVFHPETLDDVLSTSLSVGDSRWKWWCFSLVLLCCLPGLPS